ncbi:hypothetical protein SAMN05216351_10471 [Pseudobutyrivibrio sp. JW11]|uniref:hypothetical protein n=1 Tax=Pseudobutyrivibrio sp. JW11 TaxID=1855302 RepID=UPI0008ECA9C1|nr:hypothetical protein [Pseudobutyrivibrio sp. JW11]SFO18267.1 hypothetical protein SAMN05216351_10471 [Pseudobutyrivibrio sp. JW11]
MNYIENAHNYISKKLDETGMTQTKFASTILDMKQSNFNKALNQKDGHDFTLEQYLAMADYFNISLDTLFGRDSQSSQINPQSICSWIMSLYKTKRAILTPITLSEKDAKLSSDSMPMDNKYKALVFPNYDNNSSKFKSNEFFKLCNGGFGGDNGYDNKDYDNIAINNFIQKFIDIDSFYTEKGMPKEAYDIVIQKYLEELSSNPYCMPQDIQPSKDQDNDTSSL